MKKTYLIFAAVLVVLILACSFTKTYVHSLEDDAKWKQRDAKIRAELDSLERVLESRLGESKAFDKIAASEAPPRTSQPVRQDNAIVPVSPVVRQEEPGKEPERNSSLAAAAEDSSAEPTAEELAMYRLYVQRRLSLPSVISAYNLRLAKEQILEDLAQSYAITPEQVLKIVDKVYEHRRKGSDN